MNEDNLLIYNKLAQSIFEKQTQRMLVIGICGPQGSGKTTLAAKLQEILHHQYSLNVLSISIDDFYLSHKEREKLAHCVHPLLQTRGVPGTHSTAKALRLLDQLEQAQANEKILIPRFNKATDNPFEEEDHFIGRPDVVLLEGWCLGARPQREESLLTPINQLEEQEDADGSWRKWVNKQLAGDYQLLWKKIDITMFLQIESFEKVYEWRWLQEQCLSKQLKTIHTMNQKEIVRFVSHYERLTRCLMEEMPTLADWVIQVKESHLMNIVRMR